MATPTHLYTPFQVQSLGEYTEVSGVESEELYLDPWWSCDSEVRWSSVSSSGPIGNKPTRGSKGGGAVVSAGDCGSL